MDTHPLNMPRPAMAASLVLRTVLRVIATMTLVFVLYALMPGTVRMTTVTLVSFVIALIAFAVLIGFEIRSVLRATYPALRALEVIAVIFPIFLVAFSITYLSMSKTNGQTFSLPLDHISALYFTLVTFATVGFGDIVAKTDAARLMVMIQIVLDLIFIGLVVRVLLGAVQFRRHPSDEHH